ncbi:MAG: hypothetical protein ACLFS8_06925 [Clostridia bacterium]
MTSPRKEVESEILASLNGDEESFLEVCVAEDGSIHLYEAYSQDGGERLAHRLRKLGIKLIPELSSPCG